MTPPTTAGDLTAFRAREMHAYEQRVAEKVAAGLTQAQAEQLAALELSTEGDRALPPTLVSSDTSTPVV